jgi:hypothetical protein
MAELQNMLNTNNPFVPLYKQAYQIMNECSPEVQNNLQMTIINIICPQWMRWPPSFLARERRM